MVAFLGLTLAGLKGIFAFNEANSYVLLVVGNDKDYSKYRVFGDGEGKQVQGITSTVNGKSYIDNRSDKDIIITPVYYGVIPIVKTAEDSDIDGQIIKAGTSAECENFPNFIFQEPSSIKKEKKDAAIEKRWALKYYPE